MKLPRVLIAGTSSGSGKTTATCALISLLKRRGIRVKACKCGPDYIDPMFHKTVSGVPCTNLDPFFCDENLIKYLLCDNDGQQITVVEGVMGYYDGTGTGGTDNSTFTVADQTDTPVILVVDAKSSAASTVASIEGFFHFVPESHIKGVLFNRITPMNYKSIAALMRDRLGEIVVPVGFIPVLPEECQIPSRHLGLVTAAEIKDISDRLEKTADLCESTVDIDAILSIAEKASDLDFKAPKLPKLEPINLAVAQDQAFCFYYDSTLKLFERMGTKLNFFSPLADEPVPADSDGLLLGGGYPELYTDKLEANTHTKDSLFKAITSAMPTIAECGGFQYLGRELDGKKMCGVLNHSSYKTEHLVRFGYITLTARKDGVLGPFGTVLRGHEFHYWASTDNGDAFTARKPNGKEWECAVMTDTLYAGYPHLFLPASIGAAEEFYKRCLKFKEGRR